MRLPLVLTVLLPLSLGACSHKAFWTPTVPRLAPNLAAPCPPLNTPPDPLLDPERGLWEQDTVAKYGDCASKHRNTVEAWPKQGKDGK